ncbi:hypothetical protein, partial [Vibrio rumoiensis]|uniref:hypothetical protein n=1 Tax=Vibrio rumoiensis TaxID=76258 RepID=UPI0004785214
MKTLSKYLSIIMLSYISLFVSASTENIYSGMTESQHFRTYPYIDKAFKEENAGRYFDALNEVEHALVIVPNHIPFIKYAYSLSILAGKSDLDLISLIKKLPQPEKGELLFELRINESQSGELYTRREVDKLIEDLTVEQASIWYTNHLYQIENVKSRQVALNWSLSQSLKYKNIQSKRYEAYALVDIHKYSDALAIFDSMKFNKKMNERDFEYLALIYFELDEDKKAFAMIDEVSSQKSKQWIYAVYVAHLLDDNQLVIAKNELNRLYASGMLTDDMARQRNYLNSLSLSELNQFEDEGPRIDRCLKNSRNLFLSENKDAAITKFYDCSPYNTPYTWMTLAEQLQSYSELENAVFPSPLYENKRRDILISYYSNMRQWTKIVSLLEGNKLSSSHTRSLAYAYSYLKQYKRSSDLMFALYQKDRMISDVDFATYTMMRTYNSERRVADMLSESLLYSQREFLNNKQLVLRMTD